MNKLYFYSVLLFATGYVKAAEVNELTVDINDTSKYYVEGHKEVVQFQNQLLTPKSIASLVPAMDSELKKAVNDWAVEHKGLLQVLVRKSDKVSCTRQETINELATSYQKLVQAGFAVVARTVNDGQKDIIIPKSCSYILPVALNGKAYYVQLSGPTHKRINLGSLNQLNWGSDLDRKQHTILPTHQTVSRVLGFLKVLEAQQSLPEGKRSFVIPTTYLVQIPERSDYKEFACDENSFVVQEAIGQGWVWVKDNLAYLAEIKKDQIEELYVIAKKGMFTFLKEELLYHPNIKKFGATNFQQRNDQSPEYFAYTIPNDDSNIARSGYNKGSDYVVYKWGHDAKIGLKALAELLFEAHKKGINVNTVIKDLKDLFSGDEQLKNDLEKIPYGQKQYSELQEAFNKLPDNSALLD